MMILNQPSNSKIINVRIVAEDTRPFCFIFQGGVLVKAISGSSIKRLLCDDYGVSLNYVETRICTVFLDNKPVDDLDCAYVYEGCVLALSAAMPGLFGATMRRRGLLAGFRQVITHHELGSRKGQIDCLITLKLFNLLMNEIGPLFLEKGVLIGEAALKEYFEAKRQLWLKNCKEVFIDDVKGTILDVFRSSGHIPGLFINLEIIGHKQPVF